MNLKQITAMLTAAALLSLTACLPAKEPASPYEQYAHVSDNFGSDAVEEILGARLNDSSKTMTAENSEKLRNAVHDIRINNSRIALPLMVCDLPEGFTVKYGDEYKFDSFDYTMFSSKLVYEGSELADAYIVRRSGTTEQEGAIIALMLESGSCKWSVGEADSCNIKTLENAFGEPSSSEALASEDGSDYSYIADSGEFALFIPSINCSVIFALNCTELEENSSLCEYVPYDDFEGMTDLPPVSGEKKNFDGAAAFSENGVVIGDFSCPANVTAGELENTDITLVYCSTEPYDEEEEKADGLVSDLYLLLYKGRNFGVCESVRKEEEPWEAAEMYLWFIHGRDDILCDISLAGIPVSQSKESLEDCFNLSYLDEDSEDFLTYGKYDSRDSSYFVTYIRHSSGSSALLTEKF